MTTPPETPSAYQPRIAPRSEFVTLRGLRHHLLRWGAPHAGRPPLVMLHGWMDVAASFQFVVDALPPNFVQDRDVVAMDWRGFGLSASTGADAYWFPDYLGDLDALLDRLSPDAPVDLLGHSMGGNIVMSYAGVRPARIRRLINLEGFGLPDSPAENAPKRLAQWLDELKTPQALRPYATLDDVARRLRKNNPRLSPDKAQWLASHWSKRTEQGYELQADPAHKRTNPTPYRKAEALACWSRIEAPLLWVEGSASKLSELWAGRYPREDFEARLAVVRQVRQEVLADAGHMLHHDQPEALAGVLTGFLAE